MLNKTIILNLSILQNPSFYNLSNFGLQVFNQCHTQNFSSTFHIINTDYIPIRLMH